MRREKDKEMHPKMRELPCSTLSIKFRVRTTKGEGESSFKLYYSSVNLVWENESKLYSSSVQLDTLSCNTDHNNAFCVGRHTEY